MTPTRPFARILSICCLAVGVATAARADLGAVELTQTTGAALAPAATAALQPETGTQTMLWHHRGTVAFGLGVEQRAPAWQGPGLQPASTDALLVGVSWAPSRHTRLSWQSAAPDGTMSTSLAHRPMKVSLAFERRDALRELRRGSLLRMELSGQTTLALRARGGRVGLALTSRW